MHWLTRALISWIPLGIAITLLSGLIYVTVQQNYRQSLDDPQIQMAEDAANEIEAGVAPGAAAAGVQAIDIRNSLAPWIAVFDASGKMLVSSGSLEDKAIQLPAGVFDMDSWHTYAEDGIRVPVPHNEDRFTWQPRPDVRQAVVLIAVPEDNSYVYVAAGRNMREVEDREAALTTMVGLGWLATLIATLCAQFIAAYLLKRSA
jgi:hypothetical protein